VFGCAGIVLVGFVVAVAYWIVRSTTRIRRGILRQPHRHNPIRQHFRAEVLSLRGFWMLVDAAVFAVVCALIVSMPHATRPAQALESVALSTVLEDIALAASSQPELVARACESAAGEVALAEKFRQATRTFSASVFSVRCPDGNEILLSDPTSVPLKSSKSIFTNRVIVPRDGKAILVLFEARVAGS